MFDIFKALKKLNNLCDEIVELELKIGTILTLAKYIIDSLN